MSVFFFDCFDGRVHHADAFGDDFRSVAEACDQADAIAHSLLGEGLARGSKDAVWVSVRSADGRPLYCAHVILSRRWAEPAATALAEPGQRSA